MDKNPFYIKMLGFIKKHSMFAPGDTAIAAVSGGADSIAMLTSLNALKNTLGIKIIVAHVNHNLRGKESLRDLNFVKNMAKKLSLPFKSKALKPPKDGKFGGESVQVWARNERRAYLHELAKGFKNAKITVAHTKNDLVETVLMRLLKGASLSGLKGISPRSGVTVRPLLDASRIEVETYLKTSKIKHVEDSSNKSRKYLRNKVRLDLIPYIEESYNPSIVDTISRTSALLSADDEYMEASAMELYRASLKSKDASTLDITRLRKAHPAVLSRALLIAIRKLSPGAELNAAQVNGLIDMVYGNRPNAELLINSHITAKRTYDNLIFTRTKDEKRSQGYAYHLDPNTEVNMKEIKKIARATVLTKAPMKFPKSATLTAYFDIDLMVFPLVIRTFKPSDRMRPLGLKGRSKKLKDIFIDEKVPISERSNVPIVITGSEIIWAAGLRQSEEHKINPLTKETLKIEIIDAF